MHVAILISSITFIGLVSCKDCPVQCHCGNSRVKCYRLMSIPSVFPKNTTKIAFNQGTLDEIPSDAFSSLSTLVTIEFTECAISVISGQAFTEIPSLRSVRFEKCDIHHIKKRAFFSTGRRLEIQFQKSNINYIHAFAFNNLQGANSVTWRDTKISNLLSYAFYNVTKMRKLSFDSCALTVDELAFREIHDLHELNIKNTYFNTMACNGITEILEAEAVAVSGNYMNCDCGIEWMKNRVGDTTYEEFLNTTTCLNPDGYVNISMADILSVDRVWCEKESRNHKTNCRSTPLQNRASLDITKTRQTPFSLLVFVYFFLDSFM